MKPFVSLCMIVKNEEKVLGRCLDSVAGIVDEIVIVDTGSTDRTKEIARRYTDKVHEFAWTDSFADARNFAQSNASGEWILVLDADEYVDRDNLKEALEELRKESTFEALACKICNFVGFQGERIIQHHALRIYKNDPSIRFFRTIHEQLDKENGELRTGASSLVIYHSGYLSATVKDKDKGSRNTRLLQHQMKQAGNRAFDYFNLGNEYAGAGQFEMALESYKKAFMNKQDIRYSWVPLCVVQIVDCLIRLERYTEALTVIQDAESFWSNSPDFPCMKGRIYLDQHRLNDALVEFDKIIRNKERYQACIKSIDMLEFYPHYYLGKIYEAKKDYPQAVHHYTYAFNANTQSREALKHLLLILTRFHPPEEVQSFLDRMGLTDQPQKLLMITQILLNLSQLEMAENCLDKLGVQSDAKEGFRIKLLIAKGRFSEAYEMVKGNSVQQLDGWIRQGCLDFYDLALLGFAHGEFSFVFLLHNLIPNADLKNFLKFIGDSTSRHKCKAEYYLQLLERCLELRQFEVFERLLRKKSAFGKKIDLALGHLLYRYGFVELAIECYQEIRQISLYDSQAFVNIIESFMNTGDADSALQFALLALEKKHNDYRIYKYAVEILEQKGMKEDRNAILRMALQRYPDSQFLKSKQMKDLYGNISRLNNMSQPTDIDH